MAATQTQAQAQAHALRVIVVTVLQAIAAGGAQGVPSGVLYAALMAQGCTLGQFESLMGALVHAGKVRKQGGAEHPVYVINLR